MFQTAFALLVMFQAVATPPPPDEVKDALSHAEALYYAARFNDSIGLLTRVDDVLKTQPARQQERIETKLRLALAHIGLNDTVQARSDFMALFAMNPDYALDAQQFSPKVISVATDAKTDQAKARCITAQTDARGFMESGQTTALFDLLRSATPKCPGLAALTPEAAETFFKAGLASYKRGEFSNALSSFESALTLSPEHELALQYADLTRSKLQLEQDQVVVQWQRDFDAHRFDAAKADYGRIIAANGNSATTAHVNEEYRKALTDLVDNWNRSCGHSDAATMNALRGQISALPPVPSFGDDIRARMTACEETKQPAAPVVVQTPPPAPVAKPVGCIEMQSQLALTRLKTRVDPVITSELRVYLKNNSEATVRAKARISESGDVTVTGMPEGNPILTNVIRNAVAQWKFMPVRDVSGPRCVDTEFPILLRLGQ